MHITCPPLKMTTTDPYITTVITVYKLYRVYRDKVNSAFSPYNLYYLSVLLIFLQKVLKQTFLVTDTLLLI